MGNILIANVKNIFHSQGNEISFKFVIHPGVPPLKEKYFFRDQVNVMSNETSWPHFAE